MAESATPPPPGDKAAAPPSYESKKLGTELPVETMRKLLRLRYWGRLSLKDVLIAAIDLYADSSADARQWAATALPERIRERYKLPEP